MGSQGPQCHGGVIYHIPLLQYKRLSGTRASLGAKYRDISKIFFFAPPSDIVGGLATHLILFQS